MGEQEFLVGFPVHDELMNKSHAQCGIGSRANGQPLICMAGRGLVHSIIDIDDFAATRFDGFTSTSEIPRCVRTAHARLRRAVAEHDQKVGMVRRLSHRRCVFRIIRAEYAPLLFIGTVHVGHRNENLISGIVVGASQVSAACI